MVAQPKPSLNVPDVAVDLSLSAPEDRAVSGNHLVTTASEVSMHWKRAGCSQLSGSDLRGARFSRVWTPLHR